MQIAPLFLASAAALLASGALRAQFAEGFDSQATADVTIQTEPDTAFMFVDYSNMTIGATSFSLPEAPRPITGSASTRGVLLQANLGAGLATAVNILAGATPLSFSGRYRLSFDAWINVPVPLPSGSTEQLLWGVGTDGIAPLEARHNRNAGTIGVWGWLAGENGYSFEDATLYQDGGLITQLGDTQAGQNVAFNEAFDQPVTVGAPNNATANQWTRVDIDVDANGDVRVYYNGIEFFSATAVTPSGMAMIGYEDAFNSIGSNPDAQWGLFDNFRVCTPTSTACPLPGSAAIQGTATGGEILNGSAVPALGCPMTARLRGAPASAATLLVLGFPTATTIPFPLGSCTLGVEVSIPPIANLLLFSDALGNGQFSIDLPAGAAGGYLCGQSFAFQYFWIDSTACGVAHTEGLAVQIGN